MDYSKQIQLIHLALNTGGAVESGFLLPRASRILRYFAVPTLAAQAAHATIVVHAVFTNRGTDGSGSAVLATLTNDSDDADSITRESGAWARYVPKELKTEDRPGGVYANNNADAVAAGTFIGVVLTGAGATPTANNFVLGIEYIEST